MRGATRALGLGAAVCAAGLATSAVGCDSILGLSPKTLGTLDGGAPDVDSAVPDAMTSSVVPCLADGGAAPGYHDISSSACWTTFSTEALNAEGFAGGAFDGRYVYFGPGLGTTAVRYDTQADFTGLSSWAAFDVANVSSETNDYQGVVFDGRYLYVVPAASGSGDTVRYDTHGAFTQASSWKALDLSSLDANGVAFAGGAFDGRYVYYAPFEDGVVARYDTQAAFTIASWTTFDTEQLDGEVDGYSGAIFDGRYVTFVPAGGDGVTARFDTKGTFGERAAWSTFNLVQNVTPNASAFQGAASDGTALYFAPAVTSGNGGPAVRVVLGADTFGQPGSWSAFSPAELATSTQTSAYLMAYLGSLFDGRFVYFLPNGPAGDDENALLLRYDTTGAGGFTAASAWTLFDTTRIDPNAMNFVGGVFDGRYIYMAPLDSLVLRFDARAPGPLPLDAGLPAQAQYGASFY